LASNNRRASSSSRMTRSSSSIEGRDKLRIEDVLAPQALTRSLRHKGFSFVYPLGRTISKCATCRFEV
jgi:hypothetical protein